MNPAILPPDCRVYCDGGVVLVNPSPHAGTWAVCHVDATGERLLADASGIFTPAEHGMATVENNLSELVAAIEALERTPEGWAGTLFSDSQNTVRRLTGRHPSWGGVPLSVVERARKVRVKFPTLRMVLLDGHPTRQHLKDGRGKRGNPCSIWNVRCDAACKRQAQDVIARLDQIML